MPIVSFLTIKIHPSFTVLHSSFESLIRNCRRKKRCVPRISRHISSQLIDFLIQFCSRWNRIMQDHKINLFLSIHIMNYRFWFRTAQHLLSQFFIAFCTLAPLIISNMLMPSDAISAMVSVLGMASSKILTSTASLGSNSIPMIMFSIIFFNVTRRVLRNCPNLANPIPKLILVVVLPTLCEASHKTGYEK